MGKRVKDAISKALDQAAAAGPFTFEQVHDIFLDMTKHDQFLRWEFEEEAHAAFIEKLFGEISDPLFGPGRETYTQGEMETILAEVEKRRLEGWERDKRRRAHLRVVQ